MHDCNVCIFFININMMITQKNKIGEDYDAFCTRQPFEGSDMITIVKYISYQYVQSTWIPEATG